MANDRTSVRTSQPAATRAGTGGSRVAGRVSVRPAPSADAPFHQQRLVVIGAALAAMITAAAVMWLALGALPDIGKNMPIERVVFVSVTNNTLTEVDDEALKRVANALTTRGASMLQVDLVGLASMVKQVPWVREATIRRQFPSTIVVAIEEHKPVAHWVVAVAEESQAHETSTLVNSFGDVFNATIADERRDQLPKLAGPEGSSAEVLTRYAALLTPLKTIDRAPQSVVMTPRRAWQVKLDNGIAIELGRADVDERIARFIRTYPELQALQVADAVVDMRYQSGLTIRNAASLAASNKLTKPTQAKKPSA
jgi:cell division protein FtsQ